MTASVSGSPGIFICYRREDAAYPADWLYDRLADHFGQDRVFKDVDSIQLGDDFVEEITAAVESCAVLLAVIGERWLAVTNEEGQRRLDNPEDFVRLADRLAGWYELTVIDPAAKGLTRVLSSADQLVLIVPASPEAAQALEATQQWLVTHGHSELTARAVTVMNGVSRRTMEYVLPAESVARGRCRAIVRVPWDDPLSARAATLSSLQAQTRPAYTALAGVLVAGLAAGQ